MVPLLTVPVGTKFVKKPATKSTAKYAVPAVDMRCSENMIDFLVSGTELTAYTPVPIAVLRLNRNTLQPSGTVCTTHLPGSQVAHKRKDTKTTPEVPAHLVGLNGRSWFLGGPHTVETSEQNPQPDDHVLVGLVDLRPWS